MSKHDHPLGQARFAEMWAEYHEDDDPPARDWIDWAWIAVQALFALLIGWAVLTALAAPVAGGL